MLNEKQLQAKNLYFQTELSKTQIADLLNVSRRSLHYWIRENNWDRLKRSAVHLPAMLAENCYMIINQFTRALLTEDRIMRPVSRHEADTLYKLTLSVRKLKNHSTLNESMEMFAHFMERVNKKSPVLADQISPFVDEYVEEWAKLSMDHFKPEKMNDMGFFPVPPESQLANPEDHRQFADEAKKDMEDIFAWDQESFLASQIDSQNIPIHYDPRNTSNNEPQAEPSTVVTPSSEPVLSDSRRREGRGEASAHGTQNNEPQADPSTVITPSPEPVLSDSRWREGRGEASAHDNQTGGATRKAKKSALQTMEESFGKNWRESDLSYMEMMAHVSETEEERRRNILDRATATIRKVYPDYDPVTCIMGEPIIRDIDSPAQTTVKDAA